MWILLVMALAFMVGYRLPESAPEGNLETNGYTRFSVLTENDRNYIRALARVGDYQGIKRYIMNDQKVLESVSRLLGPDYSFMDYVLCIKKSHIMTCHKDNNSKLFNPEQKHPSYTIIFYIDQMENCLDVIDRSYTKKYEMYAHDPTQSIKCNAGDAVLFEAGLTHAGSFNRNPNNLRIQMKLTHRDDFEALKFYTNYEKVLEKEPTNSETERRFWKHLTCQMPFWSDVGVNNTATYDSEFFKRWIGYFYGDSNFYN